MGTVLVLAVTLALGGLLYSYSQGIFGSLTQQPELQVEGQLLVNPGGESTLQLSIQNYGNVEINVTHFQLISSNGANIYQNSSNVPLEPGQTIQLVQVGLSHVIAGEYYTVVVGGVTAGGKSYQTTLSILAQS
jgi:FlaG/FlaF family flagellin (archaellin)